MSKNKSAGSIDRRKFLKSASLAGISGLLLPNHFLKAAVKAKSKVVIVEDVGATTGQSINSSVVRSMVQNGITSLTQNNDISEAWKMLLPGVLASSVIAIKVNCINSDMPTHPEVTYAVADSLTRMTFNGSPFPENNIIIYEDSGWAMDSSGYTLNSGPTGVRCMGTEEYSSLEYNVAGENVNLSTIVTSMSDFLINIAVLKNHGSSGVTLCMKNHFGTCNNLGPLHGNCCDPYLPALNAVEPIKTKQKLNIIDALFGVYEGGPSGGIQMRPNKIIMSADIVAADYTGRKLLADYRGPNGQYCETINIATHIDTAANLIYGLGTNNPAEMDVVYVMNQTGAEYDPDQASMPHEVQLDQNYPNPFNPSTTIPYKIAKAGNVVLKVYDIKGREVATLVDGFQPAGSHSVKFFGANLASGVYVCRLQTEGAIQSRKIVFMK